MRMKDYSLLKDKIEKIFEELGIEYKSVDMDDEDINYCIEFKADGPLAAIGVIRGFIYFHHNDYSMNIIITNIYKFENERNFSFFYELINNINIILSYAKFYIPTNKSQIIYRSEISCGNEYECLNENLIRKQISNCTNALEMLLECVRKKEKLSDD